MKEENDRKGKKIKRGRKENEGKKRRAEWRMESGIKREE